MERRNLPPFWVIFGAGAVIVASLGFLLASLGRGARGDEPMITPFLATGVPVATSTPVPLPTTGLPTEPSSPLPTIAFQVAPDFTLERSNGSTFTLSGQLAQGPVVLVFFQRCGG